jgi:hypothetical protein
MRDTLDCYKVLELPPGAPARTVRKAYIALCQVWHPDRFNDNPLLRKKAEEKMNEIQDAYDTLGRFLPELKSPEPAEDKTDPRDDDMWAMADELDDTDEGLPLRYTVIALMLVAIVVVGVIGFIVFLRHRAVGTPVAF